MTDKVTYNVFSSLCTPWLERLGWTLVHSLWQIAAVAIVCAVTMIVLRHRSAQSRYLAGYAALLTMIALPVGTYAFLSLDVAPVATNLERFVSSVASTPAS